MGPSTALKSNRATQPRTAKLLRKTRRKPTDSSPPISAHESTHPATSSVEVSVAALREIRRRLDVASAVAYICAAALRAQTSDNDRDVALCLQRCVGDILFEQMLHINRLLGVADEDGDEGAA